MANGSRSRIGPIIVGVVVGGVLGYLIGQKSAPPAAPAPGPAPGGSWLATTCSGPGVKRIAVKASGPGCVDADMFAADGDRILFQSEPGTSLWIVFKVADAFPHLSCYANTCEAGLPNPSATSADKSFWYDAVIYGRQTPTPEPTTPTPTPRSIPYGRIIIKP